MNDFRTFLNQEFVRRIEKNRSYSLRAFAKALGTSHATLSSILSGKRTLTQSTFEKFSLALSLSPLEKATFQTGKKNQSIQANYFMLQQDVFASISDWHYDAILELSLLPKYELSAESISESLGINLLQAKLALETLIRLELLVYDKRRRLKLSNQNTINYIDPDFTSAAHKRYQKSILEKSMESLTATDRTLRDHSSTTMAISQRDLPAVKNLIQKFRHELNTFTQRSGIKPDEVYQLHVGFFPLTNESKKKQRKNI